VNSLKQYSSFVLLVCFFSDKQEKWFSALLSNMKQALRRRNSTGSDLGVLLGKWYMENKKVYYEI
jgi:hypothetical protein